jgi:hypothetical protein
MNLTENSLFRFLWILSLPAYAVLLSTLVLLADYRFFHISSGSSSDIPYYVVIYTVFFAVYGWYASIVTTLGVLGCYVWLLKRTGVASAVRRWASVIALSTAIAFAISAKTVPMIIPTP